MRLTLDALSLEAISATRAATLAVLGILLIVTDGLPEDAYPNTDLIEFALSSLLGGAALVMAMRDRLDGAAIRVFSYRLAVLVTALATAIVAAEFATRWVFRDVTTVSDNGGYFSLRWMRSGAIRRNAAGFRGPDFSASKPAGTYRIAVVGDSFTFGNGVRQEDRYSDLIQARLPARFEVLNFGVAGNNTPEHYAQVQSIVKDLNPDFVLLQWYVNDMEDDDTRGRPVFRPLMPHASLHAWLTRESALYAVASVPWAEWQVASGKTRSYAEYLNTRLDNPTGHDAQVDKRFLTAIIERCRMAGVPLGIVLFPDTAQPIDEAYPFGYLHDRVLQTCESAGLTCLDLRRDFAAVKDHQQLWASRFDHHPSAQANLIAAERILGTYAGIWAERSKK